MSCFATQTSLYRIISLSTLLLMVGCQSNSLNKDSKKAVEVRTQLAAEYINSGKLDAAKRSLDQALQLNSTDSTANMMMGVLLQQEGSADNLKRADFYFQKAILADPSNAQAHNNYGTYLYQTKHYLEAVKQFKIAGSSLGYDQRFQALENLGRVYVLLGEPTLAEHAFTQALQANRDSFISMLELSEIFYLKQKIPQATQMYTKYVNAIGNENQGPRALWIGVRISRANQNLAEMQTLINQMKVAFPDSIEYQHYLNLRYNNEVVWK